MTTRLVKLLVLLLVLAAPVAAQQPAPQPLTFWYDYTVKPGKEADFMTLVKTLGAPVRDKLMAEGVVLGWAIEVPVLRQPGAPTHTIWFAVNDMAGIEKVQAAMTAQREKLAADEAAKKVAKGATTEDRIQAVFDETKTRDWLTRDIVFNAAAKVPAGVQPYTRYNSVKVLPGKGSAYRQAWEKYNKPVLEKALAEGAIIAYGLGVEELKTTGSWTHFAWYMAKDLASLDKVRVLYNADRAGRSQDERDAITAAFRELTDPDASRSMITRSTVFKWPE
jgi:hypothetical protein